MQQRLDLKANIKINSKLAITKIMLFHSNK